MTDFTRPVLAKYGLYLMFHFVVKAVTRGTDKPCNNSFV